MTSTQLSPKIRFRKPTHTPIRWSPVPGVTLQGAPECVRNIETRYMQQAPSYGAFVLRGLNEWSFEYVRDLVVASAKRKHRGPTNFLGALVAGIMDETYVEPLRGKFTTESDRQPWRNGHGLHQDPGEPNAITFYQNVGLPDAEGQQVGDIHFAILVGSRTLFNHPGRFAARSAVRHELLENNLLNNRIASPPTQALKTVLEPGDALFFDHSQPHFFTSVEPEVGRLARNVYYPNADY